MKVGDLITFFNPSLGGGFTATLGILIDIDDKMIKVLFHGWKLPRWVCPTQCEVTSESR